MHDLKYGNGKQLIVQYIPDVKLLLPEETQVLWRKWIAALRSGTYEQGKHMLRGLMGQGAESSLHYCCLGVACDLVQDEKGYKWLGDKASFFGLEANSLYSSGTTLPTKIRNLYGFNLLDNVHGFAVDTNGKFKTLAMLNDSGVTFESIAMILEIALNGGLERGTQ